MIEAVSTEQSTLRLPLVLCRMEKSEEGRFRVIAADEASFQRLKTHSKLIGDAVRHATGTDNSVTLTYEKPAFTQPSLFSTPPSDDAQASLFVPEISELAIKDDVHLMEIAPWTSQPRIDWAEETKRTHIIYKVDGMTINIRGSEERGLPTHLDYDIVLLMQSWLAQEANRYRHEMAKYAASGYKGKQPSPPPMSFRVHKKDVLKFARHGTGGKQYERLESMLERLKETVIYIEQTGTKRRRRGSFSLIADWDTVSKTDTGEIVTVEIGIPRWVYQGIVEANHPSVLTYSRDYFLLRQPIARLLYRLGRLNHSKGQVELDLSELHHRSGSRAPLKEFSRELKKFVNNVAPNSFPDYDLELEGEHRQRKLKIRTRSSQVTDA